MLKLFRCWHLRLVEPLLHNNYLGKADEDNPNRDFIDADRYLNSGDTPHVDFQASQVSGGGAMG